MTVVTHFLLDEQTLCALSRCWHKVAFDYVRDHAQLFSCGSGHAAGSVLRDSLALIAGDKDASAHDMIEALFSEQKLKHSTFSKHGHAVAWGFDPNAGRVVRSGIMHGTYAGGQYGKALVDVDDLGRPRAPKLPPKTIVMVEVDLLELDEVNSDLFRRDFACSLHPLGMRGASKLDPSM